MESGIDTGKRVPDPSTGVSHHGPLNVRARWVCTSSKVWSIIIWFKLGECAVWFCFSRLHGSRELWALLHLLSVRKEKEQGGHLTEGISMVTQSWVCKNSCLGKYKLHSHLCRCLSPSWALSWCLRASCLSSVPYPLFPTKALPILAILPCFTISEGSELLAKKLSWHFGGPVAVSYRRSWKGARR